LRPIKGAFSTPLFFCLDFRGQLFGRKGRDEMKGERKREEERRKRNS